MRLPYLLNLELDDEAIKAWNQVFAPSKGTDKDKTVEESLWRRTQSEANKDQSGWASPADKNRKILYYRHEYDLVGGKIALINTYVYFSITMKDPQYKNYNDMITNNLSRAWKPTGEGIYKRESLIAQLLTYSDARDRPGETIKFPTDYKTLELKIHTDGGDDTNIQEMIWRISKAGLRDSLPRNKPTYLQDLKTIGDFFPAQLELGCGPSTEAGVLPLHTMHEIYSINEPFSKRFIMDADQDEFINLVTAQPELAFAKTSDYYSRIVRAKPTEFYSILKSFHRRGLLVGPIITNNFDGIHLRFGIPEIFVRTYDEVVVMPDLQFHPKAKTLMVVGCHADRRSIQRRARDRGLRVVYVDPEGWRVDDEFVKYPLESPQPNDVIIKLSATEAFRSINAVLSSP